MGADDFLVDFLDSFVLFRGGVLFAVLGGALLEVLVGALLFGGVLLAVEIVATRGGEVMGFPVSVVVTLILTGGPPLLLLLAVAKEL